MILLDTNVLSEAIKAQPDQRGLGWFDSQIAETLFVSSITIAEIQFGVGIMPDGKRKRQVAAIAENSEKQFQNRILPFDFNAAHCHARLAIAARLSGKGFPAPDGYIAAIAVAHGFAVATRDSSAFAAARLELIDPWTFQK
jgi:toxin FitB